MALETELKMRVEEHESVRRALEACGARFIKRQLETNTFLDTPEDELRKSGSGLRVRAARDLESGTVEVIITHKGPRKLGPLKIREETELAASGYDDALRLFAQLGYQVKLSFEKRRDTWEFGDCEVVLDELPGGLGRYVEIEGDAANIEQVRRELSLGEVPSEVRGYADLVSAHLKGSGRSTLTFAD